LAKNILHLQMDNGLIFLYSSSCILPENTLGPLSKILKQFLNMLRIREAIRIRSKIRGANCTAPGSQFSLEMECVTILSVLVFHPLETLKRFEFGIIHIQILRCS
jgi:hypothetical protein